MVIKPFRRQGNFTVIDNALFDALMPDLKANDWKILCLLLRHTLGWRRDVCQLTYREIQKGTGIKHRQTIADAIQRLADLGVVTITKGDEWEANRYELNTSFELEISGSEIEPPGSINAPVLGSENEPIPGSKNEPLTIYKEKLKKRKERGGSGSFSRIVDLYENNIGLLTEIVGEEIAETLEQYTVQEVEAAIRIAVRRNKKNWSYVQGCLKRGVETSSDAEESSPPQIIQVPREAYE